MTEAELAEWRAKRLEDAIRRLEGTLNLEAFGRRMGWADGSYAGQMVRGTRPVTEKLVRKIESMPHMAGWFDPELNFDGEQDLARQIRHELLYREVPDHVLRTVLDLVVRCPLRRKTA